MESVIENEPCASTSTSCTESIKNNITELSIKNKRKNFNPRFAAINHKQTISAVAAVAAAAAVPNLNSEQKSLAASLGGNLNDSDVKFREFAFKTMQELLNIYGLSVSQNDILEAFKQQSLGHHGSIPQHYHHPNNIQPSQPRTIMYNNHLENETEIPTPPHTPIVMCSENLKMSSKISECSVFSDYHDDRNSMCSFLMTNENSNSSSSDHNNNDDRNLNNNNIHDDDDDDDDNDDDDDDDDDDYVGGIDQTSDQEFLNDDISYDSNGQIKLNSSALSIFSPMLQLATLSDSDRQITVAAAYTKTLKKCQSYLECNNEQCQLDNLREHYHCYDDNCYGRVLNKKEEIIRHLKWHKKRSESLNHGFLRFSSSDDCMLQFGSFCQHNRKQTHYHCIQPKCDKVYISTSDVQMHSNYHRKDSAIIQEGFQRFRATEECNTDYCMFIGQRTTHFHCRRSNCNYTFKNKADMEKHKTYHIKDEQLARDGFKKFLKSESCPFESCRFSRVCNHIHCTRNNCQYVLHSSGQLLSHKRKHERVDSETAYRQFKFAQKANGIVCPGTESAGYSKSDSITPTDFSTKPSISGAQNTINLPTDLTSSLSISKKLLPSSTKNIPATENLDLNIYRKLITNSNEDNNNFEQMIEEYFTDNCTNQEGGRDDQSEPLNLKSSSSNMIHLPAKADNKINCFMTTHDIHLHCLVKECEAVLPKKFTDIAEHLKMHELTLRQDESTLDNNNLMQITSIEGFFNRKRGRPPKNRVVEVYSSAQESPQAIFTSFKLEKNEQHEKLNRSCTAVKEKKELINELDDKSDDEQTINTKGLQPDVNVANPLGMHSVMAAHCKIDLTSEEKLRSQVVRAAGTYFPQNSDDTQDTESQNSLTSGSPESTITCVTKSCKRPFCRLKRKIHHHCDLCNQAFSDEMKLKIHFLKHQATKLGQLCSTNNDTLTTSPSSFTTALVMQQSRDQPSTSTSTLNLMPDNSIASIIKPSFPVQEQIENFRSNSINFVDHISFTHSFSRIDGKPYSYVQLNPFYNQDQYPMIGVTLNERLIHEEINKQTNPGCKLQIASFISEIIQENLLRSFAAGKFDVPKYDYIEQQISKTISNKRKLMINNDSGVKTKNARKTTTSEDDNAWMNGTGVTLGQQKVFKDEPIPNGYTKFRFNEDCNFTNCGYRNHQSHFHCCRVDCFYSFCDKTRFVQHTARHERLDKLMGDDFKQYRANMRCGFNDCAYNKNLGPNNKSSHFHCLKCDFICSDTNKVVAHRRQHSKMEYIRMAGFRKVANNELCKSIEHDSPTGECSYSLKQTHYHCLICDGSVLSRAQLGSHRHRVL